MVLLVREGTVARSGSSKGLSQPAGRQGMSGLSAGAALAKARMRPQPQGGEVLLETSEWSIVNQLEGSQTTEWSMKHMIKIDYPDRVPGLI